MFLPISVFHYDVRVVFITLHVFEFVFITISCNNTVSYQFLSLRYTCCFCYIFVFVFITMYLLRVLLQKIFCVFSIFTQILQMKNEFVVIDGS